MMSRLRAVVLALLCISLTLEAADSPAPTPAVDSTPASTPAAGSTPTPSDSATPPSPGAGKAAPAGKPQSSAGDESAYPLVDRIVAVVNTNIITLSELTERTNLISSQLGRQGIALPPRAVLMRQVLDRMISDNVQLQYAKDEGIKVDDAQLDQAMERLATENKLSMTAFRAAVEKENVSWNKFREDIRGEITLARLREREVENRINISDAEVSAQIEEENARGSAAQDELNLAHILISVPEGATTERVQARHKKAEEALGQLQQGKPFAEVAAAYSEAPDALKGGNLGWRTAARLPSIFADAASKMTVGSYSDILRSPNGFHIIKLLDRRGTEAPAPISQFHARQILVKINPEAEANEASNKIQSLYARLQGGEDFAKLATISSEDESRNRGGDLGWISEGETLPQFEKVLKTLKPGEISQPFQTPLGWHIVQLQEVRQADASTERRRMAAKQGLRARKSDELYDEWSRQVRDQAYVDIRLDDR